MQDAQSFRFYILLTIIIIGLNLGAHADVFLPTCAVQQRNNTNMLTRWADTIKQWCAQTASWPSCAAKKHKLGRGVLGEISDYMAKWNLPNNNQTTNRNAALWSSELQGKVIFANHLYILHTHADVDKLNQKSRPATSFPAKNV